VELNNFTYHLEDEKHTGVYRKTYVRYSGYELGFVTMEDGKFRPWYNGCSVGKLESMEAAVMRLYDYRIDRLFTAILETVPIIDELATLCPQHMAEAISVMLNEAITKREG
jgi:hypothetical protein